MSRRTLTLALVSLTAFSAVILNYSHESTPTDALELRAGADPRVT